MTNRERIKLILFPAGGWFQIPYTLAKVGCMTTVFIIKFLINLLAPRIGHHPQPFLKLSEITKRHFQFFGASIRFICNWASWEEFTFFLFPSCRLSMSRATAAAWYDKPNVLNWSYFPPGLILDNMALAEGRLIHNGLHNKHFNK